MFGLLQNIKEIADNYLSERFMALKKALEEPSNEKTEETDVKTTASAEETDVKATASADLGDLPKPDP